MAPPNFSDRVACKKCSPNRSDCSEVTLDRQVFEFVLNAFQPFVVHVPKDALILQTMYHCRIDGGMRSCKYKDSK